MTAALHTPQDSGVQRNERSRVGATFEIRKPNAPARCPFLSLPFFWASKRKEVYKLKKILRSIEATNRCREEKFCVSTLEKEGNKLLKREEK